MNIKFKLWAMCFVFASCTNSTEVYTIEQNSITESVYASGNIVADQEYKVFASTGGRVLKIFVDAGELVEKGDTILVLESDRIDAILSTARSNYDVALHNASDNGPILGELISKIRSLSTKVTYDSLQHDRFSSLYKSNACSKNDLDKAKLAYDVSKADLSAAQSKLSQTRISLNNALVHAKNQLKISTTDAEDIYVLSKIDGKVLNLMYDVGESVPRGMPLVIIGNDSLYKIRLVIDELDMHKIELTQKIYFHINAYSDSVYTGEVQAIYPYIDKQIQSFKVDAIFTGSVPKLMSGMAVEANIVISAKENVMVIPSRFVSDKDSVLLANGEAVHVTTGIKTLDFVEIREGLSVGEKIIMPE